MSVLFAFSVLTSAVAVVCLLLLALLRMAITRGDYTALHVRRSELSLIPEQILHDRRLERIDFWIQLLAVFAVLLGLFAVVTYLYVGMTV